MKKITITLFALLMSIGMLSAQSYENEIILVNFEGDPSTHNFTMEGAKAGHVSLEIVDNPFKTGNVSDKVARHERAEGSWNSEVNVMFNAPVSLQGRDALRVRVYSEGDTYVYMRPLNAAGDQLDEGWAASPAAAGEWSYATINLGNYTEISGVRLEFSSSWGNTGADDNKVAYFDDIQIANAVIEIGEPDRIYVADRRTETINIDGFDLEDNWLDIDPTPISNVNYVVSGQTSAPANGSNFRALWDEQFLFLFIEVVDNSPTAPSGEEWWNYDGVEIFIDGKGRNAEGSRLSGQYQIRINYNTATLSGQDGATVSLFMDNGMQWAQGTMPGGYTLEVKIPWLAVHGGDAAAVAAMGPGSLVTFDVAIADEDRAIQATRYTNVIWAGVDGTHHPYESSQYWGAIRLGGAVSVDEPFAKNALRAYPSPVNDYLVVEMVNLKSYEIISITGAIVHKGVAGSDQVRISTQELNAGIYFLRAFSGNNNVEIMKLIKK
jgi:hypothetical protein